MRKFLSIFAIALAFVACNDNDDVVDDVIQLEEPKAEVRFGSYEGEIVGQSVSGKSSDFKLPSSAKEDLATWEHKHVADGYEFDVINTTDGAAVTDDALTNLSINLDGTLTAGEVVLFLDNGDDHSAEFGLITEVGAITYESFDFAETNTVTFTAQAGTAQSVEVPVLPRQGLITFDWTVTGSYTLDIAVTADARTGEPARQGQNAPLFASVPPADGSTAPELDYAYVNVEEYLFNVTATINDEDGNAVWTASVEDLDMSRADHQHFAIVYDPRADQTGLFTSFVGWNDAVTTNWTNVSTD